MYLGVGTQFCDGKSLKVVNAILDGTMMWGGTTCPADSSPVAKSMKEELKPDARFPLV